MEEFLLGLKYLRGLITGLQTYNKWDNVMHSLMPCYCQMDFHVPIEVFFFWKIRKINSSLMLAFHWLVVKFKPLQASKLNISEEGFFPMTRDFFKINLNINFY